MSWWSVSLSYDPEAAGLSPGHIREGTWRKTIAKVFCGNPCTREQAKICIFIFKWGLVEICGKVHSCHFYLFFFSSLKWAVYINHKWFMTAIKTQNIHVGEDFLETLVYTLCSSLLNLHKPASILRLWGFGGSCPRTLWHALDVEDQTSELWLVNVIDQRQFDWTPPISDVLPCVNCRNISIHVTRINIRLSFYLLVFYCDSESFSAQWKQNTDLLSSASLVWTFYSIKQWKCVAGYLQESMTQTRVITAQLSKD